jgi:hypothetical protein
MAKETTRKKLEELRRECHRELDKGFNEMFGSDGQNGLVTFTERENRACEVGDRLSCWLLETHIALDRAADLQEPCDCPHCGKDVPAPAPAPEPQEAQSRTVRGRRGPCTFERVARRCKPCRKVFFPPG